MAARAYKHHPPASLPLVRQVLSLCESEHERRLCKRAGLSLGYISQLRSGAILNPSVFHFGCLAEALGYELVLKEKSNGKDHNA